MPLLPLSRLVRSRSGIICRLEIRKSRTPEHGQANAAPSPLSRPWPSSTSRLSLVPQCGSRRTRGRKAWRGYGGRVASPGRPWISGDAIAGAADRLAAGFHHSDGARAHDPPVPRSADECRPAVQQHERCPCATAIIGDPRSIRRGCEQGGHAFHTDVALHGETAIRAHQLPILRPPLPPAISRMAHPRLIVGPTVLHPHNPSISRHVSLCRETHPAPSMLQSLPPKEKPP